MHHTTSEILPMCLHVFVFMRMTILHEAAFNSWNMITWTLPPPPPKRKNKNVLLAWHSWKNQDLLKLNTCSRKAGRILLGENEQIQWLNINSTITHYWKYIKYYLYDYTHSFLEENNLKLRFSSSVLKSFRCYSPVLLRY